MSGRRDAEDNIPVCRQLGIHRAGWRERGRHQVTLCLGYALVEEIVGIARLVSDIELGDEGLFVRRQHGDMNVRRASGIGLRTNGPEPVPAFTVGHGVPEALKVGVDGTAPRIAGVPVAAIGIALPDLDAHAGEWLAVAVEEPAAEIGDLSQRTLRLTPDLSQVVVVIQWRREWIERAGRLAWCGRQHAGIEGQGLARQKCGGALEKMSAGNFCHVAALVSAMNDWMQRTGKSFQR